MSLRPVLLLLLRVYDAVAVCFPRDVSGESGYSEQRDDHQQQSGRLGSPAGVAELPARHSHVEEDGGGGVAGTRGTFISCKYH